MIFCFIFYLLIDLTNLKISKKIKLPLFPVDKVEWDGRENFYILNSKKNILLKIDTAGNILDTFIKGEGYEIGKSKFLSDIVYDDKGKIILVSDFILKRIYKFDEGGKFINTFIIDELFGNIRVLDDTIFIRCIKEDKIIDSFSYSAFLIKKIDKKDGRFFNNVVKVVMNRKIDVFFSMPFCIDTKEKLIYMIFPFNNIEVRKLNGDLIKKIIKDKWIYIVDIFLLDKYLVISSFSENERGYIPGEMLDYWKSVSLTEPVREEILKRKLFKVKGKNSNDLEKISYVIDIFDFKNEKFIVENHFPKGKLVLGKKDKLFFICRDTLLIYKLK